MLAATVNLPRAASRRVAAFAEERRAANAVQEDCEISNGAAGAMLEDVRTVYSPMNQPPTADVLWMAVSPQGESVKAHPAVLSEVKVAAPLAIEAQLQQVMMQQFAAASETPDAVADDLLAAAAAAAAAAAEGGSVWGTSLPFSAAVRQRRFLWFIALVLVALIFRTALSTLVVVAERRVQVCSFFHFRLFVSSWAHRQHLRTL